MASCGIWLHVASEIHLNCGLSDLQVGQAAKVQDLQHLLSVTIYFKDLMIQDSHLKKITVSPFSLLLLQFDWGPSQWASVNPLVRCVTQPATSLWSFLMGIMVTLVLGGVGIAAQVRVVFLNDDLCHSIYSLGVNALHVDRSLVKEQYGFFFFNLL